MSNKYNLSLLDEYFLANNKTCMEQCPALIVEFKEDINEEKIWKATYNALNRYPFLKSKIVYEKGKFFFEENEETFKILNVKPEDRPKEFGRKTNGYPWLISTYEKKMMFEWCHALGDGKVMLSFVSDILHDYFDLEIPERNFTDKGFLEEATDKNEKGLGVKENKSGFKEGTIPFLKMGNKTKCFVLSARTEDIIAVSKRSDASPATIIPPLFSRALRRSIPEKIKNRNVSASIVINARGIVSNNTMHNCIDEKRITYIDKFDKMPFEKVSTLYRAILDLAVDKKSIIKKATDNEKLIRRLVSIRPLWFRSIIFKVVARVMKYSEDNFEFSYVGRDELPDEIRKQIKSLDFRAWPDYGNANLNGLDFNGEFRLNIQINYKDDKVIEDFIEESKKEGINWTLLDSFEFTQGQYRR